MRSGCHSPQQMQIAQTFGENVKHPQTKPDDSAFGEGGLTKREYLAAMAMQGYCASEENGSLDERIAEWSVANADALIAALNKEVEGEI